MTTATSFSRTGSMPSMPGSNRRRFSSVFWSVISSPTETMYLTPSCSAYPAGMAKFWAARIFDTISMVTMLFRSALSSASSRLLSTVSRPLSIWLKPWEMAALLTASLAAPVLSWSIPAVFRSFSSCWASSMESIPLSSSSNALSSWAMPSSSASSCAFVSATEAARPARSVP